MLGENLIYNDNIDDGGFGKLSIYPILSGEYSRLENPSKAILPVIAAFSNSKTNKSFITCERLSAYTGMSLRNVTRGVQGLRGYSNIMVLYEQKCRVEKKITYKLSRVKKWIPIYRDLFQSGHWLRDTSSSSVYIAMRALSYNDDDQTRCTNGTCRATFNRISDISGVGPKRIGEYIGRLASSGLVSGTAGEWTVQYRPQSVLDRSLMNKKVSSIKWFVGY